MGLFYLSTQPHRTLVILQWLPRKIALANGVLFGFLSIIEGVGFMIVPLILVLLGDWRMTLYVWAGVCLTVTIGWMIIGGDKDTPEYRSKLESRKRPHSQYLSVQGTLADGTGHSRYHMREDGVRYLLAHIYRNPIRHRRDNCWTLVIGIISMGGAPIMLITTLIPSFSRHTAAILMIGGIGRDTSLAFAREGADVVVADVLVENGQETVDMIRGEGGEATFVTADVSSASEVEALIDKVVQTYGSIDFAFNNAGIEGYLVHLDEYTEEMWDRVININLKGVWLCMKYEVQRMMAQGGGAIVNTSSIAGVRGGENWSVYTASKHGVAGLTKSAAIEYGPKGHSCQRRLPQHHTHSNVRKGTGQRRRSVHQSPSLEAARYS